MEISTIVLRCATLVSATALIGCGELPLARLQTPTDSGTGTCPLIQDAIDVVAEDPSRVGLGAAPAAAQSRFVFVVPASGQVAVAGFGAAPAAATRHATYASFVQAHKSNLSQLPPEIRDHSVTDKIARALAKASAQGQLNRAKPTAAALGGSFAASVQEQQAAVDREPLPSIGMRELRDFADRLSDLELAPTITPVATPAGLGAAPAAKPSPFAQYLIAYYKGEFYDRFGKSVAKPDIGLTIPDAEVGAALTVMIEYLMDLIDTTPVMGEGDPSSDKTVFYPGGKNGKKPTALTAGLAPYRDLAKKTSPCGITTDNAPLLMVVSSAAGDRAGSISGLVTQSFGGVSVGLGVLGKLSIGDNQLLATVVKVLASRLGTRITYALAYHALDSLGPDQVPPAPAPAPAGLGAGPGGASRTADPARLAPLLRFP